MTRRTMVWFVTATIALTGGFQIGALQSARADATGHSTQASCMGYETSSISPPGSSEEEIGGVPQFVSEIKELAAEWGVSPGFVFSYIARLHEGSHEDCDEALGG